MSNCSKYKIRTKFNESMCKSIIKIENKYTKEKIKFSCKGGSEYFSKIPKKSYKDILDDNTIEHGLDNVMDEKDNYQFTLFIIQIAVLIVLIFKGYRKIYLWYKRLIYKNWSWANGLF